MPFIINIFLAYIWIILFTFPLKECVLILLLLSFFFFFFMGLFILDIVYNWSYTLCGPLCLVSFTQHNALTVCPRCHINQYFIPLYGLIVFRCINIPHSVYPFISCFFFFHLLAVINCPGLKLCTSFCVSIFFPSLGSISRSGIAGLYDISLLNFLRGCQVIFQSSCIILSSHQQRMRVPISPYPCQHLLLSVFFYYSHASGCEAVSHCCFDFHFLDDWSC